MAPDSDLLPVRPAVWPSAKYQMQATAVICDFFSNPWGEGYRIGSKGREGVSNDISRYF